MDPRGQGRPDASRPQPDARELLRRVTARAEGWDPLPDAPDAPRRPSDIEDAVDARTAQHTAVLPALDPQAPQPAREGAAAAWPAGQGTQAQVPAGPSPSPSPMPVPSPAAEPARQGGTLSLSRRPGRRTVLAGIAALVVVGLLTWGALVLGGHGGARSTAGRAPRGATAVAALPAGDSLKVHDTLNDCAAHSRGEVQRFFVGQNCTSAQRYLATGTIAGRPVLFVASRVQMPSATAAAALKKVVDGNGTGNINDLLREGRSYAGAPRSMPSSGYSSIRSGASLVIAEAGFVDAKGSSSSDPALVAAAAQVAQALLGGRTQG